MNLEPGTLYVATYDGHAIICTPSTREGDATVYGVRLNGTGVDIVPATALGKPSQVTIHVVNVWTEDDQ